MIVKDVTIMDKIGQGAFATVYRAKYRRMGPEVHIPVEAACSVWAYVKVCVCVRCVGV